MIMAIASTLKLPAYTLLFTVTEQQIYWNYWCATESVVWWSYPLSWSRHRVVCRVAQETWGVRQTSVYFTGVKKILFSCICSSTLLKQEHKNFLCEFPRGGVPPIPNLSWIRQAIPEICSFKVRLIFFVFFFFFLQHFLKSL